MKIRIDRADAIFSLYIRERDNWKCQRCGKIYDRDEANCLQNSHYFGRGNENTRFDPENCDSLCFGCHQYWGSENREDYREFKIKQLGENGFKLLLVRANTYKKKDRKMSFIIWSEAYNQLCQEKNITPKKR